MQFALSPFHTGVYSTRMYWMPVLSLSIGATLLLSHITASHSRIPKTIGVLALFSLLCLSTFGFLRSIRDFNRASSFSLLALKGFDEQCSCGFHHAPQTFGLPVHYSTVNVYTERAWIEYQHTLISRPDAERRACQEEERCKLLFVRWRDAAVTIPEKTSTTILQPLTPDETLLPGEATGCFTARVVGRRIHELPSARRVRLKIKERKECLKYRGAFDYLLLQRGESIRAYSRLLPENVQLFHLPGTERGEVPSGLILADFIVEPDEEAPITFYGVRQGQTPVSLVTVEFGAL